MQVEEVVVYEQFKRSYVDSEEFSAVGLGLIEWLYIYADRYDTKRFHTFPVTSMSRELGLTKVQCKNAIEALANWDEPKSLTNWFEPSFVTGAKERYMTKTLRLYSVEEQQARIAYRKQFTDKEEDD